MCGGLPAGLHLELVAPLFFVGEIVPRLSTRAVRCGALAAVALAAVSGPVPFRLGTVTAIVGGIVAALLTNPRDR